MRILQLHSDFIEFRPMSKEIAIAEDAEKKSFRFDDIVVLFTSLEDGDDESVAGQAIEEVKVFLERVKANKILIYPYAHLSQNLASPEVALDLLKAMHEKARNLGIEAYRAPFGWNKQFSIQIKGHPLAEQSRTYTKTALPKVRGPSFNIKFQPSTEEQKLWHTASHLIAAAVSKLYPNIQLGLPNVQEEGFSYDFSGHKFAEEELEVIEKEAMNLITDGASLERQEVSKERAKELFNGQRYKLEVVSSIIEDRVPLISIGRFVDICDGVHSELISVKAIKLLRMSGAYWQGDPSAPMLQRIYGVSFGTSKELQSFLQERERIEARDHRKLGQRLDLYSFREEAPGMVLLHHKGLVLKNSLVDFWRREHAKNGYLEISTPMVMKRSLWERSGHWENFRENLFVTRANGLDYVIKPMNCPGAILTYAEKERSYRDLPLRLAELGIVHRQEMSGVLSGLFRVRSITQDDAHIFLPPEQLEEEVIRVIELVDRFYKIFGFQYHIELSTRPEKSLGFDEMWNLAQNALKSALEKRGSSYKINEGEGAFYGPKLDFHIRDALGRTWQCATIQVDFVMPERFALAFVGKDGKEHTPVIIHRVIYGSLERFIGILVEHFGGALPVWLSPVQVAVLPVSDDHVGYAGSLKERLEKDGIRAFIDEEKGTVNYKVRSAQLQKIPFMLVIGAREVSEGKISVRTRDGKVRYGVDLEDFVKEIKEEVNSFK